MLLINFDKDYLKIPNEIIVSTLEKHQRFFPIFDNLERLTNHFFVVANKKDEKNFITEGNKRVVDSQTYLMLNFFGIKTDQGILLSK